MMKTLGRNLTRIRNKKGLTRKEFSALIGMPEMELEGIEEGITDVDTGLIYEIVATLGVKLEEIFGSDETRNQVLERIKNKLEFCSEKELILIFEFITNIVKKGHN